MFFIQITRGLKYLIYQKKLRWSFFPQYECFVLKKKCYMACNSWITKEFEINFANFFKLPVTKIEKTYNLRCIHVHLHTCAFVRAIVHAHIFCWWWQEKWTYILPLKQLCPFSPSFNFPSSRNFRVNKLFFLCYAMNF